MTCKQPVSVLVLVHTADLQILLLERTSHPGYWQSVTGSREQDEPLVVCACRELAEETGIVTTPEDVHDWHWSNRYEIFPEWRHRYAPGVNHNTEHVFSVCLDAPLSVQLAPREHRGFGWHEWRTAAAACFSWSNRDAILMLPHLF